jgi:hypothetical protein
MSRHAYRVVSHRSATTPDPGGRGIQWAAYQLYHASASWLAVVRCERGPRGAGQPLSFRRDLQRLTRVVGDQPFFIGRDDPNGHG